MKRLAHFAWSCRRAVEARLREGLGSVNIGTPRGGWVLLGFHEIGQWRFFCFAERLALEARLLLLGGFDWSLWLISFVPSPRG